MIDRYGSTDGTFFSPEGTPYEQRSLALHSDGAPYHKYKVVKPLPVEQSEIAPWFGRPGGGTQFNTANLSKDFKLTDPNTGELLKPSVKNLLREGYIVKID